MCSRGRGVLALWAWALVFGGSWSVTPSALAGTGDDIWASPPHLVLAAGQHGTATISWRTKPLRVAEVWVSVNGGRRRLLARGRSGFRQTGPDGRGWIGPGYTVFTLHAGRSDDPGDPQPPVPPGPPLDYTSVTTQPPPKSTFGFSYWPRGRNSSTTLSDRYWEAPLLAVKRTVASDLDHIASIGGGVVRVLLWPSPDPPVWSIDQQEPEIDTGLQERQAANLVELIGLCRRRGLKVIVGLSNTYFQWKNQDGIYWWQWGYDDGDGRVEDDWWRFLNDSVQWINGYVRAIESSPYRSTVINYDYQPELSSGNPRSALYLRHVYDKSAIPRGKRALSVLDVARDVAPPSGTAPVVRWLQGRHLDYVSFHSYPTVPLNPYIESAYDAMRRTFPDSTIFLGEFGRATRKRADGTVDPTAEENQSRTVTGLISRARQKGIPYFLHWMLWDEGPPASKPTGLGYWPYQPKDALGSVLQRMTVLRNPDMEQKLPGGAPAAWYAGRYVAGRTALSLRAQGPGWDSATNDNYARVEVTTAPPGRALSSGAVWLSSTQAPAKGGDLLSVNAYARSNMSQVGLWVTEYGPKGAKLGRTRGPIFRPGGWGWNNWIQEAGPWNLRLRCKTATVTVSVVAFANSRPVRSSYFLDVDAVSAATHPDPFATARPDSCDA